MKILYNVRYSGLIETPKLSQKKKKQNLTRALNSIYSEKDLEPITRTLILAEQKDLIKNKEIELKPQVKEDLLMILERDRVLIPYKTSKTIAWEDRLLTFQPDEKYEVPNVIRILIKIGEQTGEFDLDHALTCYLDEIGENDPSKILAFFHELVMKVENGMVSAEALSNVSKKLNIESRIGTIIAVLKGGGVISPSLRIPTELKYEVNPFILNSL